MYHAYQTSGTYLALARSRIQISGAATRLKLLLISFITILFALSLSLHLQLLAVHSLSQLSALYITQSASSFLSM